jgi:hypothetical protein
MSRKRLSLLFDSRDGTQISGTNHVSFDAYNMLRPLSDKKINWLHFSSMSFLNVFNNIIDTNNTLTWEIYSGAVLQSTKSCTVPVGYYSSTTVFLAALTAAMDATPGSHTYTLALDSLSNKLSITDDLGDDIKFIWDDSTIGRTLGFLEDTKESTTITADRALDLRGTTSIMVKSNITDYIRHTGVGGNTKSFLHNVKIESEYGSNTNYHNVNNRSTISINNELPSEINFHMMTRREVELDMNLFDWSIELIIDYE